MLRTVVLASLAHGLVNLHGGRRRHVQLVAPLSHEGEPQSKEPMPGNLQPLACGEGEGVVFQRMTRCDQGLQQRTAVGPLHRQQGRGIAFIRDGRTKAAVLEHAPNPLQVLGVSVASSRKVIVAASLGVLQLCDGQICLHPAPNIAKRCVRDRPKLLAFHVGATEVLHGLVSIWAAEEELPEVGLVEKRNSFSGSADLLGNDVMACRPRESEVLFDEVVVQMLLVLGDALFLIFFAEAPGSLFISTVVVIWLWHLAARLHRRIKPARPLKAVARLMNTATGNKLVMEGRLAHTTPGQSLVVREDNGVGLGVALVRAILYPSGVCGGVWVEARTVEAKEVHLRRAGHDPLGDLSASASSEHHAHGVEATGMIESTKPRMRPHQRLVVWGKGLRPTNSGLDARGLNLRTTLYVARQVLPEGVVVQLEEPESKLGVCVPELGVLLIAADGHGVTLSLEVHAEVMIPHVGQSLMHARQRLGQHHGVLHRPQWNLDARHRCNGICPATPGIDYHFGGDARTTRRGHRLDALGLRATRGEVLLDLDATHLYVLVDSSSKLACRLGVCIGNARGIDGAVTRRVNTTIDVIYSKQWVHFLHLGR
mmetsp:Transcript_81163/g.146494  ORF Transcript_81163/g.146494 Transcript_81163/m.146494 type:complete len:596 (-) Transcript_81163:616-2403(-)